MNHDVRSYKTNVHHIIDIVNCSVYRLEMNIVKMKITSVLARNIKALRESHRMTLDELGEAIGTSRQHIWNLENEKSWITIDKIEKLAVVFNIEQDVLFQNKTKQSK